MGSENRQRSFKGNLKSSVTRSIAPKRVALENRRYLPERLLLPSSRYAQTEAQKGCEYSTSSATYAVKPGGNWPHHGGLPKPPWAPLTVLAPHRALLAVRRSSWCVPAQSSVQAVQRDRDECIALTDRPYLLSRLIWRTQWHIRRHMLSHPPGRKTLSTRATRSRPHSKPLGRTRCSLDAGERIAHEVDGGVANITDEDRPLAWAAAIGP